MARRSKHNEALPGSVRIFTEWSPAKLRSAERAAESGNLSYAAAVCEWLLGDDRVAGTLSARTDALMGLEPTFEPGLGRASKRAVKALEADEDFWESYPESALTQLVTWGVLLGVAPARHEWTERPDHGGRMLAMPRFWHPQTLRWDWNLKRWTIRDSQSVEHEVVAGDGEWILHTPYGPDRPWSYGLWRSLSRWVLLKQFAQGDWGRHSEKGSLLVATAPEGATKEQRRELAEDLANCGEDPVVALPPGFDLDLLEVAANTQQIYEAQIKMADLAIAIRIRGANLSTAVTERGSQAAAKQQADTGDKAKLRSDAAALSTTLHDQSLTWWANFNFGDPRLAPWPVYPVEPEEDKKERAEMVETLGKGLEIFDKLGFEIDPKKVTEEFGLTFLNGRPRETRVDPAPVAPGEEPAEGDDKAAKPKKADPKKKSSASLVTGAGAARASADGFEAGQSYVDRLVESGRRAAAEELASDIERVLELVDSVKSLDELETKLVALYGEMDPERLQSLVERHMVLAELAGRRAVLQDI